MGSEDVITRVRAAKSYYEVLGIDRGASQKEIKRAYPTLSV